MMKQLLNVKYLEVFFFLLIILNGYIDVYNLFW